MTELGEVKFEGDTLSCWYAFLEEVSRRPEFEFALRRVREIDAQVQHRYLIRIRPAKTSAIDGSLVLVWERGGSHFEIEITKDEFEWFYKDEKEHHSGADLDARAVEFLAAYAA